MGAALIFMLQLKFMARGQNHTYLAIYQSSRNLATPQASVVQKLRLAKTDKIIK